MSDDEFVVLIFSKRFNRWAPVGAPGTLDEAKRKADGVQRRNPDKAVTVATRAGWRRLRGLDGTTTA